MPRGRTTAGGRRAPAWRAILAFVVCATAPVASVFAQQPLQTTTTGVNAGRIQFFPSVAFEYGYNSNVLYASRQLDESNIIDSRLTIIQPRIVVDIPFTSSHIRFGYSPLFRNYSAQEFAPSEKTSHFFDLDGEFHLSSNIMLGLHDHLVRGTQELREVDPGGGAIFGLTPFLFNDASLELRVDLGARSGFSLIPHYSATTFESGSASSFYDYTTTGLEFRLNHRMSAAALLYVYFGSDDTNQTRRAGDFNDVTIKGRRAGVGLTRTLNRVVTASASVGYTSMKFEGGAPTDFSGLTLSVGANWLLGDVTRLDLTLRQEPYQSFWANNNYYLNRGLALRVSRQVGNSILVSAGFRYETNVYSDSTDPSGPVPLACNDLDPSNCIVRHDKALYLEAGVTYVLRQNLRWSIGYNHDGRESNVLEPFAGELVDPFNYAVNRLFVRLEAGWM